MRSLLMKMSLAALLLVIGVAAFTRASPAEQAQEEAQRAEANARVAKNHHRMTDLEDQIRKQTGLVDVTPVAVHRIISTLQEQREQLELDRAGAEGRRQGLEDAVAKLSKRLDERVASDDVAKELQKVVNVRQLELQRMKELQSKAAVAASEVSAAEANLASARAELAAARQRSVSNASAEALDGWNRQLLELSVTALEQTARLQYLEKRLTALSAAMEAVNQLEQIRTEIDVLR